jgi:hypothetical protein
MSSDKNNQMLSAMIGGGNGGKYIATSTADAAVNFLYVASDTVFTTLTDSDDTNLITTKAISGITVPAGVILAPAQGPDDSIAKIKAVSYSSGSVFGYTLPSSSVDYD